MDQLAEIEIEGSEVKLSIPSQWHPEMGGMVMDRDVRGIEFDVREMTMADRMKLIEVLAKGDYQHE